MSRRYDSEGKRKIEGKTLERKQENRNTYQRLIMACEGSVTEVEYFEDFFKTLKKTKKIAASSYVIAKHQCTHPSGVLKDLLSELEKDDDFEHKWIVIDRDEERVNGGGHTKENFNCAIQQAGPKGIKVAYSNPSFEIWYLLHFIYRNTAIDRDEVVLELQGHIKDYKKNKKKMFDRLKDYQETAIQNAKKLFNFHKESDRVHIPVDDNPCTLVYELVEILNSLRSN